MKKSIICFLIVIVHFSNGYSQNIDPVFAPSLPLEIIPKIEDKTLQFLEENNKYIEFDKSVFPDIFEVFDADPLSYDAIEDFFGELLISVPENSQGLNTFFPNFSPYGKEKPITDSNAKFIRDMTRLLQNLLKIEVRLNKGKLLELAVMNLRTKVDKITNHITIRSPLPKLNSQNEIIISNQIKELTPDCCDYFSWYNDYLFAINNSTKESVATRIKTNPVGSNLKEINSIPNLIRITNYNELIDIIISDRNNLLKSLDNINNKLIHFDELIRSENVRLHNVYRQDKTIFFQLRNKFESHITENIASLNIKIDSINSRLGNLVSQIKTINSQISEAAETYQESDAQIKINERIINSKTEENGELASQILTLMEEIQTLNQEKRELLKNCESEKATDDCITNPERLKEIHEIINKKIMKFESLDVQKNSNAQVIYAKNEENTALLDKSLISYEKFIELRDEYKLILGSYGITEPKARKDLSLLTRTKYYYEGIHEKFLIGIGEKLSPLEERINDLLKPVLVRPRIEFPELPGTDFDRINNMRIDNWKGTSIFNN
ncbi:hypothetical protein [Winogradskyella sp. R77965]|uniref:hypothetical protein n=1 Tax=Winogradskyella sp. R77965 TaxID=3093872 RepID=UPI0037DC8438